MHYLCFNTRGAYSSEGKENKKEGREAMHWGKVFVPSGGFKNLIIWHQMMLRTAKKKV